MTYLPAFFAKSDSPAWFMAFLTVVMTTSIALLACCVTLDVSDSIVFNLCLIILLFIKHLFV